MTEAVDIVAENSPTARTGGTTTPTLDAEAVKRLVEAILRERLKATVREEVAAFVQQNEQRARELSLLERIVRVEEELKALREVQMTQFAASEKRFEAMDKRFEALQREMNARFEAVDKRFEALQREMNARFEAVDKRFEAVDKHFEAVDKRFEAMDKRFTALQWMMGLGFTLTVAFMGMLKFL